MFFYFFTFLQTIIKQISYMSPQQTKSKIRSQLLIKNNIFLIMSSNQQSQMIKFKRTQGNQQAIQLAFQSNKTLEEYVTDLADLFDADPLDVKLVHKGKILNWKSTAQATKLAGATVMVVINTPKKQQKKTLTSKQQVIPGAGMSTGLGSSSPFGVGGYQVVNHPQYMSAISNAVDPDKMEEMLDDPQYQGMIQQMMQDPDTLRQLIQENPHMKSMMNNNPMMKSMLSNPAMLKMIFNKDTIKKTKEYLKNGGTVPDISQMSQNPFGSGISAPSMPNTVPNSNPNLFNGGAPQNMQYPPFQGYPFSPFYNPMMGGFGFPNPQAQAEIQRVMDQNLYKSQLTELQSMGFKDKARNLQVLREVKGDVDRALEKLCSE